jgi:predicted ATPase
MAEPDRLQPRESLSASARPMTIDFWSLIGCGSHRSRAAQRLSIGIARKQSVKSWELRATTSLARLTRDTGRRDEARAMLADIYGWFTEGFNTADLKDAKILLDELRA